MSLRLKIPIMIKDNDLDKPIFITNLYSLIPIVLQ